MPELNVSGNDRNIGGVRNGLAKGVTKRITI
jgi:hypothetical protein